LSMTEVKFGICGDLDFVNTPEELNPLPTLKDEEMGELILELNRNPSKKGKLIFQNDDLKEEIEKLIDLGVLREEEERVYVNFTFLDGKDSKTIIKECEPFAEDLTHNILKKKDHLFEVLGKYRNSNIPKEKLAFFVIGCYLLDWGSLEMFRAWGVADNKKEQPGGNEYTLWGEEEMEMMLKRIYWGGHAMKGDKFTFHTFGDHHGYSKRIALPDILNDFQDFDFDGAAYYKTLLYEKRKQLAEELADLLHKIDGDQDVGKDKEKHLVFLKKLDYLEKGNDLSLKIPYFKEEDVPLLKEALEPLILELKNWVKTNKPILERRLESVRPIQNGVGFDEFFIQLWHFIFGLTNKKLTEKNMIFDTYDEGKGYLPALAKGDTLESVFLELI